ncbi:glycoside hydrolase family 99-like domain-containing protein [Aurantimonas sp. VKM B-3413]|uniref:glycoside hydrolase family 99-like domain-containing protein n=1 Tax=Aurantimonas sp. VKM B-3413 TaxID=2779401 RepID=UPI001E3D3936|nr:glycoside hydrolase family 99-like domain-containing protein [Aurantimonas sp. VKM B-3413]MCB8836125.1 glycoside hydrolase family 99-like domain-containing protein [Aurantimonas sp. VKM B-3413]
MLKPGPKLLSFYYPGFSHCPYREAAAGRHINEWDLVRAWRPPGADCGIRPLLGFEDSGSPEYFAREAEVARTNGVDGLVYNYYFDGDAIELEQPLDTCSRSPKAGIEFALNICCRMPRRKLPYGLEGPADEPPRTLSVASFHSMGERIVDLYMSRPHYVRIEGSCLLTMYSVEMLLLLYGVEGLRVRLDELRRTALERAGLQLHVVGLFSVMGDLANVFHVANVLPFDAYSCYVALPNFSSTAPVQSYDALSSEWLVLWSAALMQRTVEIHPCVAAGWDARPRGAPGYRIEEHGLRFPYTPVVAGSTPNEFEKHLRGVLSLMALSRWAKGSIVFLGPWNEWSEGCFLLPDWENGYGRLHAIARLKRWFQELGARLDHSRHEMNSAGIW